MGNIAGGFTFRGYIPDGSDKQHIGVVLGVNEVLLKYCYGTSQFDKIINKNETEFIKIPLEVMQLYFSDPKITYIFLSARHIIDIFLITFKSRLGSEYDMVEPISREIFTSILDKIRDSNNLSERFKKDFFSSINEDAQ